jgi:hypothetical protein
VIRAGAGQAGADARGLWVNDPDAGTRIRLGDIGREMAYNAFATGNARMGRELLQGPVIGLWFSKSF